jgi:hypothetical protein
MSDANDADLEAQRARLEGQREKWRKEDDERKARLAQWKTQQEERRKERKELDRRREETLQAADREIDRLEAETKDLKGRLKKRASVLTIGGAAIGVALIWGASQTAGFGSLLMNALGTGLLFSATVAVAAYFVSRYWKAATETPSEAIFSELKEVHLLLGNVSVTTDFSYDVLKRLDIFLMEEEAKRLSEQEAQEERTRDLTAKLRERGLLPPETEQENQGKDS